MLRARAAVGLFAAAAAACGAVFLGGDSAPGAGERGFAGCSEPDTSYTTGTLHDLRSFSDAVAIVRGVSERTPRPPDGPEGWAGRIGRHVDVRVERVLWRRPNAPEPPRSFTFGDLGWTGTPKHRHPLKGCRETRLELGRRYLAPVVRDGGTWYPLFTTRMRLRGNLVVGGVDLGEPENSHRALQGRTIGEAVRAIATARPYRTVVLRPHGSPGQRWQRAYRDRFRLWGGTRGVPAISQSGVTARSRWELYVRLPSRGRICVGMSVRALWDARAAASGEGCARRALAPRAIRVGTLFARHRGLFAYGRGGSAVVAVRVRFDGEAWREPATYPMPAVMRGRTRLWVVPAKRNCPALTAQGIDLDGNVIAEERIDPTPRPPAGAPDPYAACRSG
jgi:hypothetical protein